MAAAGCLPCALINARCLQCNAPLQVDPDVNPPHRLHLSNPRVSNIDMSGYPGTERTDSNSMVAFRLHAIRGHTDNYINSIIKSENVH
jgi:hypothetical protein